MLSATSAAVAQDAAATFPKNYKVVDSGKEFTIIRVHYGPHEKIGIHDHSAHATVYVYLNSSGPVRFQHREGAQPFDIIRPPTHAGAFRVSPGRIEKHSVENLSDLPSDYLRVELNRIPLRALPKEFRGPAPVPPLQPGRTIVYNNPKLRIERFICSASGSCMVPPNGHEAILIQIPSHELTLEQSQLAYDKPEETEIQPATKGWNFNGDGTAAYQILRITLP